MGLLYGTRRALLSVHDTYESYIRGVINPLMWLRLREISGGAADSATPTRTAGTVSGCTQGQTGKLGAEQAYSWDGADDYITFPNANVADLKALTTQRWAFLINATTLGEGDEGGFFYWGSVAPLLTFLSSNRLRCTIDTNGVDASIITSVNQISDILGAWAWVFMDYDDANTLGLGRHIRMWKGLSGQITALSLLVDTVGTGTIVAPTNALFLGNAQNTLVTFAGLQDEIIADSGLWITAEMQKIVSLSGV